MAWKMTSTVKIFNDLDRLMMVKEELEIEGFSVSRRHLWAPFRWWFSIHSIAFLNTLSSSIIYSISELSFLISTHFSNGFYSNCHKRKHSFESIPSRGPFATSKRTFMKLHYLYANHQIKKGYGIELDIWCASIKKIGFSNDVLIECSPHS